MFGNFVRLVCGPLGVAVSVVELVLMASKVVDALQDDDDEEEEP